MAEEEEKEHFINVGCDPNGDEPAGADEEWRYFKNVDHPVIDLDASMLSVNIAVQVWSFVQLYVCIYSTAMQHFCEIVVLLSLT